MSVRTTVAATTENHAISRRFRACRTHSPHLTHSSRSKPNSRGVQRNPRATRRNGPQGTEPVGSGFTGRPDHQRTRDVRAAAYAVDAGCAR